MLNNLVDNSGDLRCSVFSSNDKILHHNHIMLYTAERWPEPNAGCAGMSWEAYLALDLFWFFFGSSQKRTKRSAMRSQLHINDERGYEEPRAGKCGEPTQISTASDRRWVS